MSDDAITVAENYCIACEGVCINQDPADYDHMMVDWNALAGAWMDRGATPHDVWSFIGAVLLSQAKANDLQWEDVEEALRTAWDRGDEDDEE